MSFRKIADLQSSLIPDDVDMVELLGYENYKDAPPVAYTRWTNTGSIPQHLATLQDGNGKWWEMAPSGDFLTCVGLVQS